MEANERFIMNKDMDFTQLLMRAEDEMDFMPIIPLNETDQDDANGIEIPDELALIPLEIQSYFPVLCCQ